MGWKAWRNADTPSLLDVSVISRSGDSGDDVRSTGCSILPGMCGNVLSIFIQNVMIAM